MKNFIQPGDSVDVVVPSGGFLSGAMVRIVNLFGVAGKNGAQGEIESISVEGIFSLPKLSANVMVVGDKVNFNSATDELQLATSTLDNVATVIEDAGNGILLVKVKLTPV